MLTVQVLGPVEVTRDGAPVDLGGPQQRSVIAHLALEAGHVVAVDRLVDRLWGDEPPRSPLGTLQSYVSRLRRALEPDRRQGEAPAVLVSEAPGYVLRLAPGQIDLQRFRDLVAGARGAPPARALRDLDAALGLWRGPALAGVGPDDVVGPIAVRLEEERQAATEQRFDALLALGRSVDAVPALQEAVEDDPLRERRWAQLALALYRSSRQAEALRALSTARSTLLDELGLDPGPELRELEARILAQDPALLLADVPAAPAVVEAPAAIVERGATLVGRDREWATLRAALARAGAGSAQLVLVEGEPGIGKSTLLGALVEHATDAGWTATVGRCVEPELAPSLWAWIEVARGLLGDVRPSNDRRGADPNGRSRAGAERRSAWRSLAGGERDSGAMSPVELAGSFVQLLDDLPSVPRLLVLDDLHWADAPTVDVLRLVVERLAHRRVLVVAAYRQPELVPDSVLATTLATVHLAATHPARIVMGPLAGDDVTELMRLTTGTEPSGDVAERVRRRAGGNPLFVCELARLAGTRGLTDDLDVPTAIRDVVRHRLAPLPDRATAELEVAAVLGERVDLRIVMAASDREPDDCLDALDAAIVTRILVPDGDAFRFAHALVRDAVLAEVPPLRVARLHGRAADAIRAVRGDGPDDAEPIARHRIASLPLGDPLVVAKAVVHAADMARWSGALDAGDALAERALEILAGLPHTVTVDALEAEALEAIVSAAYRRKTPGAAERGTQRVIDFAEATGSDAARSLAGFVQFYRLDQAPARPEVQEVVAEMRALAARTTSPFATVTSNFVLASYALALGRLDEAQACVNASIVASGAIGPDERPVHVPLAHVPYLGGLVSALRGDAEEARTHAGRRVRAWSGRRGDADPNWQNMLAYHRAIVETLLDEPARVLADLGREPDPDVPGLIAEEATIWNLLIGWALAKLGEPGGVEAATEAMALLDATPAQESLPILRSVCGAACLAAGDRRARAILEEARDEATARGEVWWLAETLRLLAEAVAVEGDATAAADLVDEAERIAAAQGAKLLLPRIAATRARLGQVANAG